VDKIVDLVADRERNTGMQDLKSCSLTARVWSRRSQRYILESITIPSFRRLLEWYAEVGSTSGDIPSYIRTISLFDSDPTWRFTPDILVQLERHPVTFDRLECLNLKGFHLHSGVEHTEPILKWFGRFRNTLKTLNLESCSLSPSAFQSVLHHLPLLDNVSINNECHAIINTESDRVLQRYPDGVTHFRGGLVTGINTLQEFLPCLLMVPLQFHRLVCVFNGEGHQIVFACAPTLQILNFEGNPPSLTGFSKCMLLIRHCLIDRDVNDIQVKPISFPELRTFEFWIGDWEDVEPMVHYYFPLIESAPNLSTIRIDVTGETRDSDIPFLRESSGWKEVDLQLCRLAEGAKGTITLILDVVLSLELSRRKGIFNVLAGSQFLSEFLKAGGLIRFE